MSRLVLKIALGTCIALVGLTSALMHQDTTCIFSYTPAGFNQTSAIIGFELINDSSELEEFFSEPCEDSLELSPANRVSHRINYLRTQISFDFLFILAYAGVLWFILLLLTTKGSVVRMAGLAMIAGIVVFDIAENLCILKIILNYVIHGIHNGDVVWMSKFAFSKWTLVFLLIPFYAVLSIRPFRRSRVIIVLISIALIVAFLIDPAISLPLFGSVTHATLYWCGFLVVPVMLKVFGILRWKP